MTPVSVEGRDSVRLVLDELHRLIYEGVFLPGQQLRQEEIAVRLGVSRNPVREALKALQVEGLVTHTLHQGYVVTRLRASEMEQVYLIRRLLEHEVLRSLPRLGRAEISGLRRLNAELARQSAAGHMSGIMKLNREFHFAILRRSPLNVLVNELDRLWILSESYRSFYWVAPDARHRIGDEHEEMIDAIAAHDLERLVEIADLHRAGSEAAVVGLMRDR